jgi:hypothetical protein
MVPEGCEKVSPVDLRSWILADHGGLWTRLQSAVVAHVPTERWRERPGGAGASIAWLLLHVATHQDLAVQGVVRGEALVGKSWAGPLGLDDRFPAVALGEAEQPDVTARLDLDALAGYAATVHDATHRWLTDLDLARLDDVPDTSPRMQAGGAGDDVVPWLHAMWKDKPVGWFIQWEAIGHVQGHLGEMISVRGRLGLSPF